MKPASVRGTINDSSITTTELTLHWDDPSGEFEGFIVEAVHDTEREKDKNEIAVDKAEREYQFTDLTPGASYKFAVMTKNKDNVTSSSNQIQKRMKPASVSGTIDDSSITTTNLTLSWDDPFGEF